MHTRGRTRNNPLAMELWRNNPQSILNNTPTAIIWEQGAANSNQAAGLWSVGAPTLLTFLRNGMYLVTVSLQFASNATGIRYGNIRKVGYDGDAAATASSVVAVSGVPTRMTWAQPVKVDQPGQAIRVEVLQTSGGSLNVEVDFDTDGFSPDIMVERLTRTYNRSIN